MMRQKHSMAMIMLTLLLSAVSVYAQAPPLKSLSLGDLERRLKAIDAELQQLAQYSLRSGIGAIGCRSTPHDSPYHTQWFEVRFDREYPIDEIVLVPTIWRDTAKGFQADGFPVTFRILAGTHGDPNGAVLAEFTSDEPLVPRLGPLVVPIPEIPATWVRIEATELSRRAFDHKYVFQLSELLVFSQSEDVALHQEVATSFQGGRERSTPAWHRDYLVDGFLPYLMDSAQGQQSLAYLTSVEKNSSIMLDLGQVYPLSRIHLHAIDQSDTVPQAYAGDLGIPAHLRIVGSNQPDFSDSITLLDVIRKSIYHTGPILMWRFPEQSCRYVRVIAVDPGEALLTPSRRTRFGFAEIELFSQGVNVAFNSTIQPTKNQPELSRSLYSLTDGNNLYGKILPLRQWMEELARRHDLETERPQIEAELALRYTRQKTALTWVSWLAVLLAVGIGFSFLINRILRLREIAQLKERIAADLHDELGADLHTINLLGDLIESKAKGLGLPKDIEIFLQQIRAVAKRSGIAVRHFIHRQDADELYKGLRADMERAAQRIVVDLDQQITIEGEDTLNRLKPRILADLFLFYKESLINICRHSGATKLDTQLIATPKAVQLVIRDNGRGISNTATTGTPGSLQRRAHLLRAKLTVENSKAGGTSITLTLKIRRRHRLRK